MQFIIVDNHRSRSLHLRLGTTACCLLAGVVLAVAGALFAGGMYHAQSHSEEVLTRLYGAAWQHEVREQRATIDDARSHAREQLEALAARVSKLQGHVFRLDALGMRLANMAELEDFDFSAGNPPGMGGPNTHLQENIDTSDVTAALDRLSNQLDERTDKLQAIERLLLNRDLREQILPAAAPVDGGWVSSLFGMRTHPISGRREMHQGVDFAGRAGSTIRAAGAGVVTWSGHQGGYGKMVEISHGDGYTTRYAHNKENLVTAGQRVEKGDAIALMGSTGHSTGTHVHFEVVHNGKVVNPKKYISLN